MMHHPWDGTPTNIPSDLPDDWRALLVRQTAVLTTLVARLQTAAGASPLAPAQVQALVRHAEAFLTTQAHQHAPLEREGALLQGLIAAWHPAPAALIQRLQQVEQAIAVLHASLVTARQALARLRPQDASPTTGASPHA